MLTQLEVTVRMASGLRKGLSQLSHRLLGLADLMQACRSEKVNTLVGWLCCLNLREVSELLVHCLG